MRDQGINYFIYVRKSTESDGRQVLSIPAQVEEAEKLQLREGLTVVNTFADSGSAKTPFNRPSYSDMIKRIKKGEAQGIIVWKIDRLARNHLEGGELIHLLQTGVIQSIWTPGREYQSKDSALLISLEASMASQYSVDLSENVKRGLKKKIEMGQPPLIARIGYLNTKNAEHGTNSIIPDPERWHLMRKAFDLMLTGQYTIAKIASILNNEFNFRTRSSRKRPGGLLAISVLHRAFTDPFYTGHFYYRGSLHKGSYKPMISLEEFDAIQVILGRKAKPKPKKHEFAFTGLIKCGNCGCAITASHKLKLIKATGEYRAYRFYHCTKRRGAMTCTDRRYTTESEMQQLIEKELVNITLLPKFKSWLIGAIKDDYNDELEKQELLLNEVRDHEQKLIRELDSLLELRISQEINEQQYLSKKAERQALLMRVREKQLRLKNNVNAWLEQVNKKLEFAVTALEVFKTGDPKIQRTICGLIGRNWTLKGKKLEFIKHDWFLDIVQLSDHFTDEKDRLEPIKTLEEYKQTSSFQIVYPILCGLREHIRTGPPN